MATDQFNIRLRYGLGRQVRVKAAELGCQPRDVVEDALELAGFRKITEGDPGPNQLRLSEPQRADIAPNGSGHASDPRTDVAAASGASLSKRSASRRVKSRNARESAAGAAEPAAEPGCPECGGQLTEHEASDLLICTECQYVMEPR